MKRLILLLLLILLVLILMLLIQALAAVLVGTETGSRWLLSKASRYLPGTLSSDDVSGTWLAGINVGRLHYQLPGITIQAEDLALKLNLPALWHGEVRAIWLYASNVRLDQSAASPAATTAYALPEKLSLPLTLSVDDLRLQGLSLHRPERTTIQLDLVTGSRLSAGSHLSFDDLLIRHRLAEIAASEGKLKLVQPYTVKADIRWSSSVPELSAIFATDQLDGKAALSGSLPDLHIRNELLQPALISSRIDLQPFSGNRDFRSLHRWQEIIMLQPKQQPLTLRNGTLELSSQDGLLSAMLDTTLHTRHVSNLVARISAEGNWTEANKLHISAAYADSHIQAFGNARWLPGDAGFNLVVHDSHLDSSLLQKDLTGRIGLTANLSGTLNDSGWNMLADSIRIDGTVLGKPLQASLNANVSQKLVSANGEARYADNHADIDIRVNDSIAGDAHLSLNDLQALNPQLRGAAEIKTRLRGTRKAPEADITIVSKGLRLQEYLIDGLTLKAENLGPDSPDMMLSIASNGIWHRHRRLVDKAGVELNGAYSNHSIGFSAAQDGVLLESSMSGGFQSLQQWSGSITSLDVSLPNNPPWRLLAPASVELSAEKAVLAPLCLSDMRGEACLDYAFNNGSIASSINLSAIPLAPLSVVIGNDTDISGSLDGRLTASRSAAGIWQGQANSTVRDAKLIFSLERDSSALAFEDASVSVQVTDNTLVSQANISIRDYGYARASLTTGLQPDAALSGELSLALTELRWLEILLPQLRQNRGSVDGRLVVAGTRQSPQFSGALGLRDAGTDIPVAGLSLSDITARLSGNGPELQLSAEAASGPGVLQVQGRIDASSGLPLQIDLAVTGERFLAIDLPEARVLIDPDLRLHGSTGLLMLRGDIGIPEAALRPQQLPEMAVRVSDDEVIVNASAEQTSGLALDTDIMLRLGSNVRFAGFGLDAKLGGNLQLLSAPSRPVALTGELRIDEGRYRAYGQNLEIDRGLLIFQQRIDNPGLDIRAVRRIPSAQIVAGVAITGTLQSPQARLTSEPPMEESEIMAWLLTGRGLSGSSETDNAMIAQALAVYGLEKGSGVTEKIGEKVGLDEISVGSNWETTDASLMLGKQISNRLYLRYAIGLFDALSTVMLRYTVSRRVHLEAQSGGDQQSIDLIYQIER